MSLATRAARPSLFPDTTGAIVRAASRIGAPLRRLLLHLHLRRRRRLLLRVRLLPDRVLAVIRARRVDGGCLAIPAIIAGTDSTW